MKKMHKIRFFAQIWHIFYAYILYKQLKFAFLNKKFFLGGFSDHTTPKIKG